MNSSELNKKNFKKICLVNGLTFFPILILLSWPYFYAGFLINLPNILRVPGSVMFGLPFTLTILHGIVTVSVGSMQRRYFYDWLRNHPYTYGLPYHPLFVSTRFRLALIGCSLLLFVIGLLPGI